MTKYWSTQNYFNRVKTTIPYYSLVLNKARHADNGYKIMDLERHQLLIKLDPASKEKLDKHSKMPNYITHGLVHKKD